MFRTLAVAVLFLAVPLSFGPGRVAAQHSVGVGSAPHGGGYYGGGYGYFGGPRLHLGPLPYPNRHANPIWQLHPNLYPRVNIPGSYLPGNSIGGYSGVGGYYSPGSYLYSGYVSPFGYNYAPSVTYIVPPPTVVMPPQSQPYFPPAPKRTVVAGEEVAEIQVRVPANAKVWFDGVESALAGSERDFATAPIPPGLFTTYEIRARWTEEGRTFDQTRRLNVRGGGQYVVDFTLPEEAAGASK